MKDVNQSVKNRKCYFKPSDPNYAELAFIFVLKEPNDHADSITGQKRSYQVIFKRLPTGQDGFTKLIVDGSKPRSARDAAEKAKCLCVTASFFALLAWYSFLRLLWSSSSGDL